MFLDLKSRVPVMAASCVLVTSEQLLVPETRLRIASITAAVRSHVFVTVTTRTVTQSGSEFACPRDSVGAPSCPGVATNLKCRSPSAIGAAKLGVAVSPPVKGNAPDIGVSESGPST